MDETEGTAKQDYFCRPAWHGSNVPGCKPCAVWNIGWIVSRSSWKA